MMVEQIRPRRLRRTPPGLDQRPVGSEPAHDEGAVGGAQHPVEFGRIGDRHLGHWGKGGQPPRIGVSHAQPAGCAARSGR